MTEQINLRPITIEMFKPDISAGSRHSLRARLGLAHLMDEFCGTGKQRFYRGLNRKSGLDEETANAIDKNVFEAIRSYFHLPNRFGPRQFYIQQQKQAIGVIRYFGEILPELRQDIDPKNEISMLSDRPSDLFWLLSRPSDSIDRTLEYEVYRHALLSINSGMINATHLNERSLSVLSNVFHHLDRTLFEGKLGEGEQIVLDSAHDNITNRVVGFPEEDGRILPTAHHKIIPFSVRKIPEFGRIYTRPRKKGDSSVLCKGITDAVGRDGVIRVDAIEDRLGMMCVVIEKCVHPKDVADLVVDKIKLGPREVSEIVKVDTVDQNRGQSQEFKFNARRIIKFKHTAIPLEMVFLDLENYLNSVYEVGDRDSETGLYLGRAHELYELRRGLTAASILFPKEIYPIDLADAFLKRSIQKAEELLHRNRV